VVLDGCGCCISYIRERLNELFILSYFTTSRALMSVKPTPLVRTAETREDIVDSH